ncbi:hypothetical protein COX95_00375 [bacterium CG_4_10_14_0_2_um_filter_33_32]|nr:MAG: hypothetical protein AUJ93_01870 [bacterium CG2_30_33_46]PIR67434.1 MAG: hypothetical protein COU50_03260 [bacterium CG10_big_fil_rev_8_21_14_0_10_33_18]PIU76671.1 MAG: hypothetical protein COS74_02850 [bacterium CG06_land_8_20_14_3_00_33_50]PIW81464.1 MAG: hypothetical protein COZ97_01625 [bacterium CG_4_8_14_3_um_filter_33_28]PIY85442.1 MAG: hypothetical protein COY76_02010 [bacterium CG_4_10_14_0_8_um_filter_33_57]PIZ86639.1 MAG: hypothetical protein COX95_00375 [bacterium CG_4_10_1
MIKIGQIIKKVKSKKDKNILIRVVGNNDAIGLKNMINCIIDEDDFLLINKKVSLAEEKQWLEKTIKGTRKDERIFLCALTGSKIIGSGGIERKSGRMSHVGNFGITILKEFREEGIGKCLMSEVLKIAKKNLKVKLITIDVCSTNERAFNFYKKMGFKVYGELPKAMLRRGRYISILRMYKEI